MADIERIERELREGLDMLSSWQATKPVSNFSILHKMTIGDLRALLDELARRAEIIERAKEVIRPFADLSHQLREYGHESGSTCLHRLTANDIYAAAAFLAKEAAQP